MKRERRALISAWLSKLEHSPTCYYRKSSTSIPPQGLLHCAGLTAGILIKDGIPSPSTDLGSIILPQPWFFLSQWNKLNPGKCYKWWLSYSPGPKLHHPSQTRQEGTRKTWKEVNEWCLHANLYPIYYSLLSLPSHLLPSCPTALNTPSLSLSLPSLSIRGCKRATEHAYEMHPPAEKEQDTNHHLQTLPEGSKTLEMSQSLTERAF